jgi:tetratricopeptide (TPR) repeat protein
MAWTEFPHPNDAFIYTPPSLQVAWARLHAGDAEPFPVNPRLVQAWIAFHAGDFEQATRLGLDVGVDGYSVAHKASCIYATYLEKSEKKKVACFEEVAERCLRQQQEQPDNAAGYYWHAYALGRYALSISVVKALAQGLGAKCKHSLDATLKLAPLHADAHIVLGAFHSEIIDQVGAMVGGMTYGVKKETGYKHFQIALELHPNSAICRTEYAKALVMLDGKKKLAEAIALCEAAVNCVPRDAMERLDVEAARIELKGVH